MAQRKEPAPAVRLAAILAWENGGPKHNKPYQAALAAEELVRLAKRAASIAVRRCNGIERPEYTKDGRFIGRCATWTEADEAAADRAGNRIRKRADEILAPFGGKVLTVSGDPRGCVMRLELSSGATNGMGEGWGL